MSDQAIHIFNPAANLDPSLLVHLLESWAKADPNPLSILSDLRVTTIMHNKMPNSPEHEFLVVKTEDQEQKTRLFILERTVDPVLGTVPGEGRPTALESAKQLCAAMSTTSSDSDLASVEEGVAKIDRLTITSVQAAKMISDSVDNKGSYTAVDRFMGRSYVYSKDRHGENVRFLIPNRSLSLYQLAIIAKAVHNRFPNYDVLKEQCYFHAGLIYSAVLHHFGALSSENQQEEISIVSGLKYGRYRGLKVKTIDHQDVLNIVDDFKAGYAKAMADVSV
jgi:hypothetical protein